MRAYLRAADVFLCASEHEGFCVPLAQAMALDVPVVAYAAAAVPETMGEAGLLVHQWDAPRVAELVWALRADAALRARIVEAQRRNVTRFSAAEARGRLAAAVAWLEHGEWSLLFERLHANEIAAHS